jgi:hypothetical protein
VELLPKRLRRQARPTTRTEPRVAAERREEFPAALGIGADADTPNVIAQPSALSLHAETYAAESIREPVILFRYLRNAHQNANSAVARNSASPRVDVTNDSAILLFRGQQRTLPASLVSFAALEHLGDPNGRNQDGRGAHWDSPGCRRSFQQARKESFAV